MDRWETLFENVLWLSSGFSEFTDLSFETSLRLYCMWLSFLGFLPEILVDKTFLLIGSFNWLILCWGRICPWPALLHKNRQLILVVHIRIGHNGFSLKSMIPYRTFPLLYLFETIAIPLNRFLFLLHNLNNHIIINKLMWSDRNNTNIIWWYYFIFAIFIFIWIFCCL